MRVPTNSDLGDKIDRNHQEVSDKLIALELQVKTTNGRLKDLERIEIERKAVDRYRAEQTVAERDLSARRRFDVTTVITIIGVVGTLIGSLWWIPAIIQVLKK